MTTYVCYAAPGVPSDMLQHLASLSMASACNGSQRLQGSLKLNELHTLLYGHCEMRHLLPKHHSGW